MTIIVLCDLTLVMNFSILETEEKNLLQETHVHITEIHNLWHKSIFPKSMTALVSHQLCIRFDWAHLFLALSRMLFALRLYERRTHSVESCRESEMDSRPTLAKLPAHVLVQVMKLLDQW